MEALLLTHPAVADVGVVGVPDAMSGELPRAYIVKKANVDVTEQDLTKFVEGMLLVRTYVIYFWFGFSIFKGYLRKVQTRYGNPTLVEL